MHAVGHKTLSLSVCLSAPFGLHQDCCDVTVAADGSHLVIVQTCTQIPDSASVVAVLGSLVVA